MLQLNELVKDIQNRLNNSNSTLEFVIFTDMGKYKRAQKRLCYQSENKRHSDRYGFGNDRNASGFRPCYKNGQIRLYCSL